METIGIYNRTALTADPASAVIFAVIGWIIVFAILSYALYKWYKRPIEVAKKS